MATHAKKPAKKGAKKTVSHQTNIGGDIQILSLNVPSWVGKPDAKLTKEEREAKEMHENAKEAKRYQTEKEALNEVIKFLQGFTHDACPGAPLSQKHVNALLSIQQKHNKAKPC